jgi:WD40 repeat protein
MAANPRYPYVAAGDVHGMVMIYPFEDIVQPDFILPAPVLTHMRTTVQQLCWSKDGQYLASLGQDQSILIKNTQDPSHQKTIFIREEIDKCPMHIVWTTDTNGTQIFVIGYTDGTIEYYNEREDFRVGTIVSINPNVPIHWMAEKQTTPQLAVTIGQEIAVCTLFGAEATNSVVRHPHPEHLPKMIAWSEDGTLLASTDAQHMIRIWNTSGTTLTLRAQYLATKIKCLLWTEQWLLLGDSEKIIYWDMSTERGLQIPPKQMPVAARFLSTADGKIVLGQFRFCETAIILLLTKAFLTSKPSGIIRH